MQTFIVRFLRLIATIAWVFFLVVFIFVEIVIITKAVTGDHFQHDITVQLRSVENLPPLNGTSDMLRLNHVIGAEAKLRLDIKPTMATAAMTLVGFTAIAFAILAVVFQIRKILRSIRSGEPFDRSNFRRLWIIGVSLLSIAILELIGSLFDRFLLENYGGDAATHYIGQINWGLNTIIMAMIVLVLSEVFRQGNILKTENEAFV